MSYRSESAFSDALTMALRKKCPFVQRIESALTGRGIPDLYCRFPEHEVWVELKNDKAGSIYGYAYRIDWRKGQQAWHFEYVRTSGQPVLTVVAMRDGFVVIPLFKRFIKNLVTLDSAWRCSALSDVVDLICAAGK
jgi:hypothetical protein